MAERTSTPDPVPFFVDGSVPQQAYIRSGPHAGSEVMWTKRRREARDEYQAALLEASLETVAQISRMP